jgi:ABC-type transport system involved in multi-copper enzyme maturation permease subunit
LHSNTPIGITFYYKNIDEKLKRADKKVIVFLAICLLIVGISLLYEDLYTVSKPGVWSYSSKYYLGLSVLIVSIPLFAIGVISKEKE